MSGASAKSDRPSAAAEFWYYFSRNKGAVIGLAVARAAAAWIAAVFQSQPHLSCA